MAKTLNELSKEIGISRSTISRVINNKGYVAAETREKVEEGMRKYNYIPNLIARGLRTEVNFIGVITHDFRNPYFTEIIYWVEKKLRENGYTMLHVNSDNNLELEKENIIKLLSTQVKGIICLNCLSSPNDSELLTATAKVPVVIVEGNKRIKNANLINADNTNGMIDMLDFLYDNGHSKIGFASITLGISSWNERYKVYLEWAKEKGIVIDKKYSYIGIDYINQLNDAYENKCMPTALFTCYDANAVEIYNWCAKKGIKIGDELSIVGFDDIPIAKLLSPGLTTVRQPVKYIGEVTVDTLLARFESDKDMFQEIITPTNLIIRNSVKKIEKK